MDISTSIFETIAEKEVSPEDATRVNSILHHLLTQILDWVALLCQLEGRQEYSSRHVTYMIRLMFSKDLHYLIDDITEKLTKVQVGHTGRVKPGSQLDKLIGSHIPTRKVSAVMVKLNGVLHRTYTFIPAVTIILQEMVKLLLTHETIDESVEQQPCVCMLLNMPSERT